jgi:HTH-type transcriptional regulator, cell division transcriptional repressor
MTSGDGVGHRIRQARLKRGMSSAELGRAVGVTGSAANQWEMTDKGKRTAPTHERLVQVANALRVDVRWLITGEGVDGADQDGGGLTMGRAIPFLRHPDLLAGRRPKGSPLTMSHYDCSDQAVAAMVWSRAMEPIILHGDTIVLDPAYTPEPGDIVAAIVGDVLHIGAFALIAGRRGDITTMIKPCAAGWPEIELGSTTWRATVVEYTRRAVRPA